MFFVNWSLCCDIVSINNIMADVKGILYLYNIIINNAPNLNFRSSMLIETRASKAMVKLSSRVI